MSTQKRALDPTSSGEPSQPKRPCLDPNNQEWNGSERNLVPSSYLTVEDVRRVVIKEAERVLSQWAEYFQSCIRDALKDIAQRLSSTENAVKKLTEAVELANVHSPHLARAIAKSTATNDARNLQLQLRNKLRFNRIAATTSTMAPPFPPLRRASGFGCSRASFHTDCDNSKNHLPFRIYVSPDKVGDELHTS
ncbi:hypothetical protein NL676_007918 [Syzygium grande]|nr:hypothetical protein NL676_007918 [Syzygium grande]